MMVVDITRRLFEDAGIGPGQRVLDLGCGLGGVSALVADLVGPAGAVVGVDRDPTILAQARARAEDQGLRTVTFVEADLDSLAGSLDVGTFDAIVARRVLMYLPRPVDTLRAAVSRLRAGGIVVLQEHDTTMAPASSVPMPERQRLLRIVWEMVRREGGDPQFGFKLAPVLAAAGLHVEHVRADAIVEGPDGLWQAHHPLAGVVRAVAHRIAATGAASEEELGLDGLEARLAAELHAAGTPFVGDVAFGAWGRRAG